MLLNLSKIMTPKMMNLSEENLELVWLLVFEDPKCRTSSHFWVKDGNVFNDVMGCRKRNLDAICSNFHDMNVKRRKFDKVYNFVINNVHKNDIDPVVLFMYQYEDLNH